MTDRTDTVHLSTIMASNSSDATRTVLQRFPAGGPRGSWPAEEFAAARRLEGLTVQVVMNLATDTFDVKQVTV